MRTPLHCERSLAPRALQVWIWLGAAACGLACSSDGADTGSRVSQPGPIGAAGTASDPTAGASGGAPSAGTSGFANPTQQPTGNSGTGGATLPTGEPTCAEGMANTRPVTPTVWLVVDGSSSMTQQFDGTGSRWQTLRSTLMEPDGVVARLEHVARIGMVIYSGGGGGLFGGGAGQCPNLVIADPALDNYMTLDAAYPFDPIGTGTPTDRALDHVVTNLPVRNEAMLDAQPDPIYVVLATDGQPNDGQCTGAAFGADFEQLVVDVTTRGTQMGMKMFVISLAGGDNRLQAHLEQVAQATQSQTPPFVPSTREELISTFEQIVGGATCVIALEGRVKDGQQCMGEVTLNGQPLACDSDNGWRLNDPSTVQLTGTACESFRAAESQVRATFPCGVLLD